MDDKNPGNDDIYLVCPGEALVHDVTELSSVNRISSFTGIPELAECFSNLLLGEVGVLLQHLHVEDGGRAGVCMARCVVTHLLADINWSLVVTGL